MITSRTNPKVKQLRALRQRKERDATGLFIAEGITQVAAALEAHARVEYVCYAPDLLTSSFARDLIASESTRGLSCYPVAPDVFEALSEKDNPTGISAVVHQAPQTLARLTPDVMCLGVALVSPQDPGNIGSILRTMDAVGASGLLLLDGGADAYHPHAVRASLGAVFSRQIVSATFGEFAGWARQHAYHVVGTSARANGDYRAAHYELPLVLLLGSEQKGLSAEHLSICAVAVRMPMLGRVTSLNLSVAAGVMLYEILAHCKAS